MPKPTDYPKTALTKLKLDKKVKALVPRPSKEDRAALKAGLKAEGQKKPVTVLPDLTLVDGYTRVELLKELGVERIMYEVVDAFPTDAELHLYAISTNLERRQLDDFQRGELILSRQAIVDRVQAEAAKAKAAGQRKGGAATKGVPKRKKDAPERSGNTRPPSVRKEEDRGPRSRDVLAKAGGLKSGRQLEKIAKIKKAGSTEQQERVRSKKATINQVYNEIRKAERAKEAAKKAAKVKDEELGGRIICADAFEMEIEHPGTVDLVIVDPPYGIAHEGKGIKQAGVMVSVSEALSEWGLEDGVAILTDSLVLIDKLLREGGSFYLFIDRLLVTTAWDVALQLKLKPRNTVYWRKTNPTPSGRGNWSSAVEVMIYGTKPGKKHTWNLSGDAPNFIETPVAAGKERVDHPTQKPVKLYSKLIEASSNPGDLVCDFMAGSGTCGVAARELKRPFVLVEKLKKNVNTIKARLA